MRVLLTGGLGFIGSAVVRLLMRDTAAEVLNVDVGTYAATTASTEQAIDPERYRWARTDIVDGEGMRQLLFEFGPDVVVHLAAESHVDRSIDGPLTTVRTNVLGTAELLEAARAFVDSGQASSGFRLVHVSTDEVFGSLALDAPRFNEATAYDPRSPYSASKAAADHLVRAWYETYDLPAMVLNATNNYGPFQFPEKLIPLMIVKGLAWERLPVYGRGENIRDWLHVDDHARAIVAAMERGRPGQTYLVGGDAERTNLQVVEQICDLVDAAVPDSGGQRRRTLIQFVEDRPGHDLRYGVDPSKARDELGWAPSLGFEDGLARTVEWYVANRWWWEPILAERYDGARLGRSRV